MYVKQCFGGIFVDRNKSTQQYNFFSKFSIRKIQALRVKKILWIFIQRGTFLANPVSLEMYPVKNYTDRHFCNLVLRILAKVIFPCRYLHHYAIKLLLE